MALTMNINMKTNNIPKMFSKRNNQLKRGFTLVEMLIALSITGMLLAATAVAFNAAFTSYSVNTNLADVNMSARNSLHQMCSTIRMAVNDPAISTIDVSDGGNKCSMTNSDGQAVIYKYDPTQKQLLVNIDADTNWYLMADDVHPISVNPIFSTYEPVNSSLPAGTVGKIDIRFSIASQQYSKNYISSAIPRNVIYTY